MQNRSFKSVGGGLKRKIFHNIFDEIISLENLFLAWDEFKKGKKNKFDVQKFEYNLEDNIFQLHRELKTKTYHHLYYTSFYVKDPKLRHIHKACVKDRVLHHAIFRLLYPIFDPSFIFDSYSCRIGKGTHNAINRLQKFLRKDSKNNTKNCFILKCDVRKFFDSVDHNTLISLIKNEIYDENAVWLIKEVVKSFSTLPNRGLPLGNITSQLFANIYLNELDTFIKYNLKIRYYIRYCDDFVILNSGSDYLEVLIVIINRFLSEKLKLYLHSDKIEIRKYHQGIDFLGYVSFPHYRVLRTKTKKRMFQKMREKAEMLVENKISKELFYQSLQSYLGILKHCNSYKLKEKLLDKLNEESGTC